MIRNILYSLVSKCNVDWIRTEWNNYWLARECRLYGHCPNMYRVLTCGESYCTRCGKKLK